MSTDLSGIHETKELNVRTKENLDRQILELESPTIILSSGKVVSVKYELCLSMVDGKVVSHITNTSSFQCCTCCSASPKQMNNIDNITNGTFKADPSSLVYGISSLHCWIRLFETLLHISYRIHIKKWQVRTESDKLNVRNRKMAVQEKFVQHFNMRVDMPTPGGSLNSNTGNVARRAFANPELLSTVLDIDISLIKRFHIILIAISCDHLLDNAKFKLHCIDTFKLYIQFYEWYPMPSSLHRILVHGIEML